MPGPKEKINPNLSSESDILRGHDPRKTCHIQMPQEFQTAKKSPQTRPGLLFLFFFFSRKKISTSKTLGFFLCFVTSQEIKVDEKH